MKVKSSKEDKNIKIGFYEQDELKKSFILNPTLDDATEIKKMFAFIITNISSEWEFEEIHEIDFQNDDLVTQLEKTYCKLLKKEISDIKNEIEQLN